MGMSDLSDTYICMSTRAIRPECKCVYIRKIMSAHATTNIFHLGDIPASVRNYRINSQVYLYWPLLTLIMINDVSATTNP